MGEPRGRAAPGDGRAPTPTIQERDRRAAPRDRRRGARLWAGDLYRMLTRYAERRGFEVEPLEIGDGTYTFAVKGDGAYSVFKWEGGTHRVQRVPVTESQGRIHTSAATVRGAARGRGRRGRHQRRRPGDRRLPLVGARRAVRDTTDSAVRITPQADRHRRLDAGREEPAAEIASGRCVCCALGSTSAALAERQAVQAPIGAPRSAPATARAGSAVQLPRERVTDPPRRPQAAQPRGDPEAGWKSSPPRSRPTRSGARFETQAAGR